TGVVSLSMLLMHGAAWLGLKTEGEIAARARRIGTVAGMVAAGGYLLAGLWLAVGIDGYRIVTEVVANGPSNPLYSEVARDTSWLAAYVTRPWIIVAPIAAFAGIAMAVRGLRAGREGTTLLWSKLAITGIVSSVGLTMFPFILPSSSAPDSSLTVWDASSSQTTLFVMLVATAIFMPLILAYTAWVYKVLWGKVTEDDVTGPGHSY
ncbi:cytochrome d ubiquinol oxidase subunit II, partial [Pararhodobacter sp. CCB-MM2]|uniref:cytochrome d ubiquinol oxidase subunit II n=1 Tax=Pararhodobacter sp. CCB-MM2 TaxID=1786003 RepID=UPI000829FB46